MKKGLILEANSDSLLCQTYARLMYNTTYFDTK